MQIRSVTAHAFGPLRGETLELAEGMTVVVGDNESAKSSWHAAIYAAVCGRRRGRGRPREDEQRFIDLHRPWDHDDWLVTAQLVLDDGRRIELRNDLAGKVDCHAKDLDLGRDVSAEVMNDGAPDGARWLGLDRASFAATACVEQAQLLRVLHQADGLQEHLQRAAATAGTDATAAAALDRLDQFFRERVGLDRANSSKPLRQAMLARDGAERVLSQRREAHRAYLSRLQEVAQLRHQATRDAAAVQAHEAATAQLTAEHLSEQTRRAGELSARYGDQPPPSALDDDAVARQITDALSAWRARPATTPRPERSSEDLQQEIDSVPPAPEGDVEPHPSVMQGISRLERATAQSELHETARPREEPGSVVPIAVSDEELLDLARILDSPPRSVPPALIEREAAARAATQGRGRSTTLIAVGAALVVLGVILAIAVAPGLAAVALIGLAVGAAALLRRRAADRGTTAEMVEAQAALQAARSEAADAVRRHEQAVAQCAELGIAAEPAALRAVAVARTRTGAHERDLRSWAEQRSRLQTDVRTATAALAGALHARGQEAAGDHPAAALAAAHDYQQTCRARADQARRAARLTDLQRQLVAAQAAEARAAQDERARAQAAEGILAAARAVGVAADAAEVVVPALQDLLTGRTSALERLSAAQQDWAELQSLLAGRLLADLQRAAHEAASKAARLVESVDPQLLSSVNAADAAEELPALRLRASGAESSAAAAEGELRQYAAVIGSVAEAEEALDHALAELHRVQELQETLQLTRRFLQDAQTRVHRDIAPLLAHAVQQWLPGVSGGRYVDVMVDPTTLQVQICGPTRRWRRAGLLSYGTAEQVYLLLRLALADQLTKGHDTCPLLLDDVTVHADAERTREVLELLLTVAEERQIVLFTQEQQVAAWAREHLTGPRHAVRELTPVPVG